MSKEDHLTVLGEVHGLGAESSDASVERVFQSSSESGQP